ncbi:MAG: polyphosphate:AMP phosphotransferase [Gammaproteobacteria bacterium]|nr:MAG: polyphosphate:AMP phosphotransferase [Gammaproteobacteria bacterium]
MPRFDTGKDNVINKVDFQKEQDLLHADILKVQRSCREAGVPLVILVSGVEAAGKSAVVNRLSKWLDMRNVRTISFWHETEDERSRPHDWRFWRELPGKGEIAILFGSWYTRPIIHAVTGKQNKKSAKQLKQDCDHIIRFEKLLADDGVVFVKLWFHISSKEQTARIKAKKKAGHRITPYEKNLSRFYDDFAEISHKVMDLTDKPHAPWHVVDATDRRYRDLTTGKLILKQMQDTLTSEHPFEETTVFSYAEPQLYHVNLDQALTEKQYDKQMKKFQARLAELHWRASDQKRSTVLVFEGWDAAGKGGAIRRLTGAMDARLFRVIPIAAPTDEEKAHHYLWRFWRQLPVDGQVTIYDRSWYGRVLVERVEGFTPETNWQRAYDEINDFEEQLVNHGVIVSKFWIHIDPDEQLRRFEEREKIEHKKHKLTEEDWRNREKWATYEQAVDDMLVRTNKKHAPWFAIPGNDKFFARIEVLKAVCKQMEKELR